MLMRQTTLGIENHSFIYNSKYYGIMYLPAHIGVR